MTTTTIARRATWCIIPVLFLAAVLVAWRLLPVKDWIQSLDSWIGQLGAWGIIVFAVAYVVVVISLAPADIMSLAAGLIFGLWGIPLVVISATIGATCAFLIARYLARERVKEFMQKREVFKAVDAVVKEEGWKLVALFRLNPLVPFNLQNYFFGITEVGLLPYVVATFFGIMPGTAAYVYIGTLGQVAATGETGQLKIVLLGVGLLTTVLLVWIVGRRAKAMLKNLGVGKNEA
ncbi:MAG: TVP38/TMEM64 family protein [Bradyrhizobiaceae bacterium]|nr:TVP38/TMEM64 family protein [Bradyrhizobiaceae bacterium]